jgi:hypothetical protein
MADTKHTHPERHECTLREGEVCLFRDEREGMTLKLDKIQELIRDMAVSMAGLDAGVKRINGTLADHEIRLRTKTEQISILQEHDRSLGKIKWGIYGILLAFISTVLLEIIKGRL